VSCLAAGASLARVWPISCPYLVRVLLGPNRIFELLLLPKDRMVANL
jgi:hypothetical protein